MIHLKTIDIPEYIHSDSERLKNYLQQAELLLSECYTLVLKMKQCNQITDDELVTNVADAWHYSQEALNQI